MSVSMLLGMQYRIARNPWKYQPKETMDVYNFLEAHFLEPVNIFQALASVGSYECKKILLVNNRIVNQPCSIEQLKINCYLTSPEHWMRLILVENAPLVPKLLLPNSKWKLTDVNVFVFHHNFNEMLKSSFLSIRI